jgi:two-component system cell cycle sensor histidine kinase/response regulator CckA
MSEKHTSEEWERSSRELEKAETDRKFTEDALVEQNRIMTVLLNNLRVGVFMVEAPSGKPLLANRAAKDLLGRGIVKGSFKDNLAEVYEAYKLGTKDHYPADQMPIFHGLQGRSHTVDDMVVVHPDGKKILLEVFGSPVRDQHGNVIASLVSFSDITERKRTEEEKEKLKAQFQQAQRMKTIGTLAGGIAHNFNNMLMAIQGLTSLMTIGKEPSHPDYKHLQGIEKSIKKAVELTRDLLGFARGGKYEPKPTDLNTLIRNENKIFCQMRKEIQIHGKYEEELWSAEVDRGQIQQTLLNLYLNAWQAMPDGGDIFLQTANVIFDESDVKFFAIDPGRYIKISVTDTGIGMDEATRNQIFEPFFSKRGSGQGSGLGLASVYGIVKNHGGFINVDSEKGKGSTFNIYLPASKKKIANETPELDRRKIQYGQGTILLVDDQDMVIDVGKKMLESIGYKVLIAQSGSEALDVYIKQKDEIDLIILDMIHKMWVRHEGANHQRVRVPSGKLTVHPGSYLGSGIGRPSC